MDFEQLLAEGQSVEVTGWDFSWFAGRATEQRTSWGYATRAAERLGTAATSLDIQTGGAEVYSFALSRAGRVPQTVLATEPWPPNLPLARAALAPFGGTVHEVADADELPFDDQSIDLILSRLPSSTPWQQIARVLSPGGVFLSQQVGHGTNRELYEFMMGPQWVDPVSSTERLRSAAEGVGLEVVDLRYEETPVQFFDLAAVVVFLRKVVWTVPDFSVEKYRDRLRAMHEHIRQHGRFDSYSRRCLIEARKPAVR